MGTKYVQGSIQRVTALVRYLGGQMITLNGANVAATIPSDTKIVIVRARGGAVYYSLSPIATASSPGYIPSDGIEMIGLGAIANLTNLAFYGAAGAYAHVQYFDEE